MNTLISEERTLEDVVKWPSYQKQFTYSMHSQSKPHDIVTAIENESHNTYGTTKDFCIPQAIRKIILLCYCHAGWLSTRDFKLHCRAIVIKTAWSQHTNRHADQENKTDYLSMNACSYSHLIFGRDAEALHWRRSTIFNKWFWKKIIWVPHVEEWRLNCIRYPAQIFDSKGIKGLTMKPEILKLLAFQCPTECR